MVIKRNAISAVEVHDSRAAHLFVVKGSILIQSVQVVDKSLQNRPGVVEGAKSVVKTRVWLMMYDDIQELVDKLDVQMVRGAHGEAFETLTQLRVLLNRSFTDSVEVVG